MMSVVPKWRRRYLFQFELDRQRRLAGREARAVGDAEDVRVDCDRLCPERDVHHHIGGLAADAGQLFERVAISRHLSAMLGNQPLGERDHILGFHVEESDGPDVPLQPVLPQRHHLLGRFDLLEQFFGGLVDADVGRLRGQHHGNQQRIGVYIGKLGFRRGIVLGEATEEFEDVSLLHSPSTSAIR